MVHPFYCGQSNIRFIPSQIYDEKANIHDDMGSNDGITLSFPVPFVCGR